MVCRQPPTSHASERVCHSCWSTFGRHPPWPDRSSTGIVLVVFLEPLTQRLAMYSITTVLAMASLATAAPLGGGSAANVAAVPTTIEAEGAPISDGKGIATRDNQTLTVCSPHSRFYSFRGSSRFTDCPTFSSGQRREVRVNFRSYNNDAYYIKIEVCASGSSTNCVSSKRSKYSGSGGAHNVNHLVSDRGYSRPYVKITFECDNWVESCQIDMTGADQFTALEGY